MTTAGRDEMRADLSDDLNFEPKRSFFSRVFNWYFVVPGLMFVFIACAPFAYRSSQFATVPDIGDPFDVAAFCEITVLEEENAFKEYCEATRLLTKQPTIDFDEQDFKGESLWQSVPPEIQKWVEENRKTLTTWQKGTEKPDALYIQPANFTLFTLLPDVQAQHQMSRLARLEASRLAEAGQFEAAWKFNHALFRCSRHVGRHGCPIERLVGTGLHRNAVESTVAWAENPRVTEAMLQQALADVRNSYQLTESFETAIKVEYVAHLNTLAVETSQNNLVKQVQQMNQSGDITSFEMFMKGEPEMGRRLMQHWCADLLERYASAANGRAPIPKHLSQSDLIPMIENSPVARALIPSLEQAGVALRREQARQSALETMLAAQIHFRRHGRFPVSADELLQECLPRMPVDPFAPPLAMKYRYDPATNSIVVWSIGENVTNDDANVKETGSGQSPDVGIKSSAPLKVPKN